MCRATTRDSTGKLETTGWPVGDRALIDTITLPVVTRWWLGLLH